PLDSGTSRQRDRLRHTSPRLPGAHDEPAAPVEGGSGRILLLRRVQCRRLLRRCKREGEVGNHLEGALPERRARSWQATTPGAAVLLRVVLAAGHDSAAA